MTGPLWEPRPEDVERAGLTRFTAFVRDRHGVEAPDYAALHAWSVAEPAAFWDSVWEHCGVVAAAKGGAVLVDADRMPGARWFPEARLNFAENLLRRRDDGPAIVFRGEAPSAATGRIDDRRISWRQLHDHVSRAAQGLRAAGVGPGDRVAGYLPNLPETVVAMLAATSLGAVWSSCSPDFGAQGVLDRFGQIEPKVLVGADGYRYNGAPIDSLGRIRDGPRRGSEHRADRRRPVSAPGAGPSIGAGRDLMGRADPGPSRSRDRVRAGRLRPPALRHVLVRDHRRPQVHRPRHGRNPAPASQGAPPPRGRAPRRHPLLLHHLRVDDVELARVGARERGLPRPLRGLSRLAGHARALRLRGRGRDRPLRDLRQVPRRGQEVGAPPARYARPL